jgi:chaperonin GroEL
MTADGTTTATILASTIYSECVKNVAAGCNPMDLHVALNPPSTASSPSSLPTPTPTLAQVTTISANGDVHIRNLIAQAMEKVGKEDVITVKEGRTIDDKIEITKGMWFNHGLTSLRISSPTLKSHGVELEKLLSEKIRL